MKKPHVNALEWYQMNAIDREKYTPRKLSDEDLRELNKVGQLQVKREIQYAIQRARMEYAVENTSEKRREKFIKKYHGDKLGTRNTDMIVTDRARLKYAVANSMNKWYGGSRVKNRTGKGSRGGVRDLSWYITTGRRTGIPDQLLTELDIIADNLHWSELQELYYELPDLDIYYPKDLSKRSTLLDEEMRKNLALTMSSFLKEMRKTDNDRVNSIFEAIKATFNEPEMSTNPEDYQETIPGKEE